MEDNKIIIYQTKDGQTQIDVRLENDTVWLTQAQMADLFQKDQSVIARHISNVFKEGELDDKSNMHFCIILFTNTDQRGFIVLMSLSRLAIVLRASEVPLFVFGHEMCSKTIL